MHFFSVHLMSNSVELGTMRTSAASGRKRDRQVCRGDDAKLEERRTCDLDHNLLTIQIAEPIGSPL